MWPAVEAAVMVVSLFVNIGILLLNAKIKSDISSVKVYMHEKFMTREEFLMAMNPPTFPHKNGHIAR